MFQNRESGFDMGLGDEHERSGRPFQMAMPNGVQVVQPRPMAVTIADIYQAAVNQAVHDFELNKLFNPDCYDDYQI